MAAPGAQGWIAAEIGGLVQGHRFAAQQGHRHQLVAAVRLHHTDPAVAPSIDQATAEGPGGGPGERDRLVGGCPSRAQVQAPEAAVPVIDKHGDGLACDLPQGAGPTPIAMDAAAQVPVAWG